MTTYRIDPAGPSITCLACGMTSHHPGDVENLYCGNCHVFHAGSRFDMPPGANDVLPTRDAGHGEPEPDYCACGYVHARGATCGPWW